MGITNASIPESTAQRLRCQHECLETLIGDRSGDELRLRPLPEKWSVLENIAHLAAYQQMFSRRVTRMLTEDDPALPAYIGDTDPRFLDMKEQAPGDLLADLSSDRLYLHDWLMSLGGAQLARTGTHSRYGTRSLLLWIEFFLLHEAHHLETIWKLTSEKRPG